MMIVSTWLTTESTPNIMTLNSIMILMIMGKKYSDYSEPTDPDSYKETQIQVLNVYDMNPNINFP